MTPASKFDRLGDLAAVDAEIRARQEHIARLGGGPPVARLRDEIDLLLGRRLDLMYPDRAREREGAECR